MTEQKIGIIGLGRMGKCLLSGLLQTPDFQKKQLYFTTKHEETGRKAAEVLGINRCRDNEELVRQCDTVVLAVKPQNAEDVLAKVGKHLSATQTLISIVASVPIAQIEAKLEKGVPVIRAMPNTPAFVRAAITAMCLGTAATEKDWHRAVAIFQTVGRTVRVDEKHMDAVTGLSGCGPAYLYVVLESLTDAGIKVGLPRELATELSAQTVLGAAKMLLETGRHPAALKDEVTTPAGCTIDGLMELEEGKLRVTLIKAVVQATKRAGVLAKLPDR